MASELRPLSLEFDLFKKTTIYTEIPLLIRRETVRYCSKRLPHFMYAMISNNCTARVPFATIRLDSGKENDFLDR